MSAASPVGMNLAAVNYFGTEFPFIDRMKTAGVWGANGVDSSAIKLDANGYPTAIPAGAGHIYTLVGLDPESAGTSKTYVLTYKGEANFTLLGATILSREPGKITFTQVEGTTQQVIAVSGLNAQNPLTDMHVVRSDQVDLFNAGEIFNPTFLEKISAFDTLRYMDWNDTNANLVKNWADRVTPSNRSWQSGGDSAVPLEVMVALANKSKTNMWLNVPTQATDDYVRQMMQYVKNNLDPSLSVKLEYSNEVWNWSFYQSGYAQREAAKLWGKDANGDGVINPTDPAEQLGSGWVEYYGYRAAQIAKIANDVFAGSAPDRLHNVLGTQTGFLGIEEYILKGVSRANLGSAASLFDDYAVTTYFGSVMRDYEGKNRDQIVQWARSGDAGIAAAVAAIKDGLNGDTSLSLVEQRRLYAYQADVAKKNGLTMVAYEGGLDVSQQSFPAEVRGEVFAFLQRLKADPRMGALYTQMLDDFTAAGGGLAVSFIDAQSDYFGGGMFGTLSSIYDKSPAWDALVAAQARAEAAASPLPRPTTSDTPTTAPTPTVPVVPTVPATPPTGTTDKSSYAMADGEKVIAYIGTGAFSATGNALDNTITAGSGGSTLNGGAGADVLIGGAGTDRLDGGIGADTLIGNAGDDVYLVDSAGDVVIENADGGTDEVRTTLASYTLDGQVENLSYIGAGGFTGVGNAAANVLNGGDGGARLSGGGGNDRLNGGAGVDTLDGGAGDDVLDGGAGDDVLTGGTGDDVYIVSSIGDRVVENLAEGTDEIRTTLTTYMMGANVEKLTYTGTASFTGTGNALDNVLTAGAGGSRLAGGDGADTLNGGTGADYLDGGAGADRLVGGAGNDVYTVDDARDVIVEERNGGADEVRTTLGTYLLGADVENLTFTGAGGFQAMGNALDNVIVGGSGQNRLLGNEGRDTLTGGDAADVLDGGTGADRMTGGGGNDIYFVDDAGDVVSENANGGLDTVYSTVTHTLGANVENLALFGASAIDGTGNAAGNTLIGNSAVNRLSGAAGNDFLYGGAGDDVLDGGDGDDSVVGDDGADTLIGGAGDDVLIGGAGNDVLTGGAGADGLNGNGGADRFVFRPGDLSADASKTDRVFDFSREDGDKIDLSAFDAVTSTSRRDSFTFVGAAAFSKRAGELRVDTSGFYQVISGDLDGDGVADFTLNVSKGSGPMIGTDFVL